jgi:hypothetical protein
LIDLGAGAFHHKLNRTVFTVSDPTGKPEMLRL